ncbi:MAG: peptidylprolyl isomerase [Fimbriimonadales bacterium]|nr:peptidylprolyl isomerase [Fimbriimonadales bacterium]
MQLLSVLFAGCLLAGPWDLPKGMPPAKPEPQRVLATVDGQPIRASDLEAFLWDWRSSEVLQDLISYRSVLAFAGKEGVRVTEREIEEELNRQLSEVLQNAPTAGDPNAQMRREGFPRSRLWLRVHSQLLVDRVLLKRFDPKNFVKVSTIVVRKKGDDADSVAEAAATAKRLFERLSAGEAWSTVLREATSDERVLSNDGSIGWKLLGAFSTPTAEELRQLRPGGITKPALTANGFQIFRLDQAGATAQGKELLELQALYLFSERPNLLRQIQETIKVEVKP